MRGHVLALLLTLAASAAWAQELSLDWVYRDAEGGGDWVVIRAARVRGGAGESTLVRIPIGPGAGSLPVEVRRAPVAPERAAELRRFLAAADRPAGEYRDPAGIAAEQSAWLRLSWGPAPEERMAAYQESAVGGFLFAASAGELERWWRLFEEVEKAFPAAGEALPWDRTAAMAQEALASTWDDPACPEGVRLLVASGWMAHERVFGGAKPGRDFGSELTASPSVAVRAAAARARLDALGIAGADLAERLAPLIEDADAGVSARVAEQAAGLVREARELGPVLDRWVKRWVQAGAEAGKFPTAMRVLRSIAPDQALRLAVAAVHPASPEGLRAEGRRALEVFAGENADLRAALGALARDADPKVRSAAIAESLDRFGAQALDAAAAGLEGAEPWVRPRVVRALATADDPRAFDLLLTVARGEDVAAAAEAMRALAERPAVPYERVRGELIPLALRRAGEDPAFREALGRWVESPTLSSLLAQEGSAAARAWWHERRDRLWWDAGRSRFSE